MPPDAPSLLAWYDRHARVLPWRVGPKKRAKGVRPDPYRVWLSEVMLQQTTVAAVKAYFLDFTTRWPTVEDLASAPRDDVMKAWAGLGYYARARNLKACADKVAGELGGRFPATAAGLKALPGIGDYTAAAIAAIAYDEPVPVVDGNIERVVARLFAIDTPLPAAKPIIRAHQARFTPKERAGDFAQAMMDLGATICMPRRPACALCPWSDSCAARAVATQENYPVKAEKAERPVRFGAAFVAIREDGAILLRQRPDKGLLGGMTDVPGSEWSAAFDPATALEAVPFAAGWHPVAGRVVHVFTHFRLELSVFRADLPARQDALAGTWWSPAVSVAGEALPTVFRKVIEAAVPGALKRAKRQAAWLVTRARSGWSRRVCRCGPRSQRGTSRRRISRPIHSRPSPP